MFNLQCKVAVVTGGSSGIGLATVKRFLEQDYDVTVLSRTKDNLTDRPYLHWIQTDVSNSLGVKNAIQEVISRTKTIDVLVNDAGARGTVTSQMPLSEAEPVWEQVVSVNLKGAFLVSLAAAPYLKRPGGRIINVSSVAAFTGGSGAGSIAYAASKAGVIGLTRAFARELSKEQITVNVIAPGLVGDTKFFENGIPDRLHPETMIPAGRAGTPDDIAATISFLASRDADYITGEVVNVNGGWLFR